MRRGGVGFGRVQKRLEESDNHVHGLKSSPLAVFFKRLAG